MNPERDPLPLSPTALLAQIETDRVWGCSVLDIRDEHEAHRDHLRGSAWIGIPDARRAEDSLQAHLLPARGALIAVVDDDVDRARTVAEHLCHLGFRAAYLNEPMAGLRSSRSAWAAGPAPGALWSPDPYLLAQVDQLDDPAAGPILDLGAGNGRNAVFLAARGYDVLCVDRLQDALELAHERAHRHGVRIRTLRADVRRSDELPLGPFAGILMIRFLEKGVFAELPRIMRAGAVLLLHAYAEDGAGPDISLPLDSGPRRQRFRLDPREWARLAPQDIWERVHELVESAEPGGRPAMLGSTLRFRG